MLTSVACHRLSKQTVILPVRPVYVHTIPGVVIVDRLAMGLLRLHFEEIRWYRLRVTIVGLLAGILQNVPISITDVIRIVL